MIRITADEKTKLVPTSKFAPIKLPYKKFNPIQSAIFPHIKEDANLVIAAPTASGKTMVATMASAVAMAAGGTVLYASPFKALTEERKAAWSDPQGEFPNKKIVVLTGDYTVSGELKDQLNSADMVLLTSEMLDARGRQGKKEKLKFLTNASLIIVDEVHLLGSDRRGDRLESGLMAITRTNPNIRLVFLSATMKNAEQVADWATLLNGKETILLESSWRPSKLNVSLVPYSSSGSWGYAAERSTRVQTAVDAVMQSPKDSTIVFVHSKVEGRMVTSALAGNGIVADFYSADLSLAERRKMLSRFSSGDLPMLVATSAASVGINLPCKVAVVCGTYRGLTEVDPGDIQQAIGRAGRPQFDAEGFAYVVVKAQDLPKWNSLLYDLPLVRSRMEGLGCLRFHIVSLIDRKVARTPNQLVKWFDRSLMASQGRPMTKAEAQKVLKAMYDSGIVKKSGKDTYENKLVGTTASRLYFDPEGVADWASNWTTVFSKGLAYEDTAVAWAIARSEHFEKAYSTRKTKDYVDPVRDEVDKLGLYTGNYAPNIASTYYGLYGENITGLTSTYYTLRQDIWRLVAAWKWLAESYKFWDIDESYFDKIGTRIQSGASWEEAEFCQIPGLGITRARRLISDGVDSLWKFLAPESKGGMRETAKELMKRKPYSSEKPSQYYKVAKAVLQMQKDGSVTIKKN